MIQLHITYLSTNTPFWKKVASYTLSLSLIVKNGRILLFSVSSNHKASLLTYLQDGNRKIVFLEGGERGGEGEGRGRKGMRISRSGVSRGSLLFVDYRLEGRESTCSKSRAQRAVWHV